MLISLGTVPYQHSHRASSSEAIRGYPAAQWLGLPQCGPHQGGPEPHMGCNSESQRPSPGQCPTHPLHAICGQLCPPLLHGTYMAAPFLLQCMHSQHPPSLHHTHRWASPPSPQCSTAQLSEQATPLIHHTPKQLLPWAHTGSTPRSPAAGSRMPHCPLLQPGDRGSGSRVGSWGGDGGVTG